MRAGGPLTAAVFALAQPAWTGDTSAPPEAEGIFPSLGALWFVPENLRLRYPDAPLPDPDAVYTRRLPFFAQEAIERGFALPEPYGIALSVVSNRQEQIITDLSVALGKGTAPPQDTDLVSIPFVQLDDVISDTNSLQLKADAWVLPNVNVFGSVGRVEGDVDLDVLVDLDEIFGPGLCPLSTPVARHRPPLPPGSARSRRPSAQQRFMGGKIGLRP